MKKILIAIDGGVLSEKIAQKGYELAKEAATEVALVYVVDTEITTGEGGYTTSDLINTYKEEGKEILERLKRKLSNKDIWIFTEVGNPAKTIIKLANEWDANMIVIGTHGRTGLNHLLMGSVAEHVIRHATVPVLVISAKVK
ncbi:nucleotide-binding universal stress UspA family protein [Chitinophaga polysaccharea]|uniref:Universal stress protein n=1 Tax=Chitinophaga polysaccharea TaxID=1293035 RepID=A0A561PAZ4_9BACT|nr:universal stress protein [Chitinophaga polysaccharea]TWF35302.1 nucleotide-binding universal stress UspA family protein [Chitinophaga polysaccharea]